MYLSVRFKGGTIWYNCLHDAPLHCQAWLQLEACVIVLGRTNAECLLWQHLRYNNLHSSETSVCSYRSADERDEAETTRTRISSASYWVTHKVGPALYEARRYSHTRQWMCSYFLLNITTAGEESWALPSGRFTPRVTACGIHWTEI